MEGCTVLVRQTTYWKLKNKIKRETAGNLKNKNGNIETHSMHNPKNLEPLEYMI